MNFLISHVTRRPPVKVTQRKLYKDTTIAGIRWARKNKKKIIIVYIIRFINDFYLFQFLNTCFLRFTDLRGTIPIILYKDRRAWTHSLPYLATCRYCVQIWGWIRYCSKILLAIWGKSTGRSNWLVTNFIFTVIIIIIMITITIIIMINSSSIKSS